MLMTIAERIQEIKDRLAESSEWWASLSKSGETEDRLKRLNEAYGYAASMHNDLSFLLGDIEDWKLGREARRKKEKEANGLVCDEKVQPTNDAFDKHLTQASNAVKTWPKWKQELLGGEATIEYLEGGDADGFL